MSKFAIRFLTLAIYAMGLLVVVPTVTLAKSAMNSSKQLKKHKKVGGPRLSDHLSAGQAWAVTKPSNQAGSVCPGIARSSSVKFGLLQWMMILIEKCREAMAVCDVLGRAIRLQTSAHRYPELEAPAEQSRFIFTKRIACNPRRTYPASRQGPGGISNASAGFLRGRFAKLLARCWRDQMFTSSRVSSAVQVSRFLGAHALADAGSTPGGSSGANGYCFTFANLANSSRSFAACALSDQYLACSSSRPCEDPLQCVLDGNVP